MNQRPQRFQDQMDSTRRVEVIDSNATHYQCRVYFKEGHKKPTFGGITVLPQSLFSTRNTERGIGFVSVGR